MSTTAASVTIESHVTPDLPGRIRRAIVRQDRAELNLLNPIIRALAYNEVTVGEIKALDAEQALWLVAERAGENGRWGSLQAG